jgi:hypothetical protein
VGPGREFAIHRLVAAVIICGVVGVSIIVATTITAVTGVSTAAIATLATIATSAITAVASIAVITTTDIATATITTTGIATSTITTTGIATSTITTTGIATSTITAVAAIATAAIATTTAIAAGPVATWRIANGRIADTPISSVASTTCGWSGTSLSLVRLCDDLDDDHGLPRGPACTFRAGDDRVHACVARFPHLDQNQGGNRASCGRVACGDQLAIDPRLEAAHAALGPCCDVKHRALAHHDLISVEGGMDQHQGMLLYRLATLAAIDDVPRHRRGTAKGRQGY